MRHKEKDIIMDEFKEFLKICKSYLKKEPSIIKLIKKRHRECSAEYLKSSEFYNSLHITRAQIESNPKEVFLYLRDFLKELKSNKRDENELKRKREDTPPGEDHLQTKKFKEDGGKEDNFSMQSIPKSSSSAIESGNVCEISERCAKPGTSLANTFEDKFEEEEQGETTYEVEGKCESDLDIQIESLESSSEEEGPKRVTVSNEKEEAFEGKHNKRKKVLKKEEDEDEIPTKQTVSIEEEDIEDECPHKDTVSVEKVEDFEVVLNEDYSNGSTGSSLVNYNISGINKDSACDSTVLDEPETMLESGGKSDIQSDVHSSATKKHFTFEKDQEESSNAPDEDVLVKSNELSSFDRENDDISESAIDKYPDSTTTEPIEKGQREVPVTPSKFKDVFKKLKTTVSKVKTLSASPKHAVPSPDSSSRVDSVSGNVDSHDAEAVPVEEEQLHLQTVEKKEKEMDEDFMASRDEDQAKSSESTGLHIKSKSRLSLKCNKNVQEKKNTSYKKDSCESGETNEEKYIVISSSQETDEDIGEKPDRVRKLADGFQNAGESPIKIVQVTSGADLEAMDSMEEQQGETKIDPVSRNEEEKNSTQNESKHPSQKILENPRLEEETEKKRIKTEVKSAADEPSTSAKGMTKKEKKGSKRQIERLEKLLKDIRDKIEELKEAEVDLDDEDSAYIMEEKYQKKFVKVWNKLCEIKESSTDTGRPVEKKFRYKGTRYPEINKKIEKFINKRKCFPDYHDVKDIISSVNKSKVLRIKTTAIDRLAREAFADVGDQLQKRREEDFKYTFLGHLPPEKKVVRNEDDPAYDDKSLQLKLEENKKISKSRLNEVLEKYAQKQERRGEDEEDEDETQEDEEDTQEEEEYNEEIDVPEMDQIINDESQDETLNTADTCTSKETKEKSPHLSSSNIKKENTEPVNQEQYSEVTIKEVWETVTVKDEKEDEMKAIPVVLKPLEDDVVYIDNDDEDDDDNNIMVPQEDLLDFSQRRTKQKTENVTKPAESKEKKSEVPKVIQNLHKEIMNQFNSIKSNIHKGQTLSTSKIKPEVHTGSNAVDITGEGRKFPGYQVKNISKKASSGASHTVSSKNPKGSSKTNQYKASLSVTNDSRASCSVTSDKRKGSESSDIEFVGSNILESTVVRQTNTNTKDHKLKKFKDGGIEFIPLNEVGAKLLEKSVNPESLNPSERKTKSDLEEVVVYPKPGMKIINPSGTRDTKAVFEAGYPKPGKKVINLRPTGRQEIRSQWHHMMGTSPVLLDDSDSSSPEGSEDPLLMSCSSSCTKRVQNPSSSAQGSSDLSDNLRDSINSSKNEKTSAHGNRLSHSGENIERKYVPTKTAVTVLKHDEDDDIIVLD